MIQNIRRSLTDLLGAEYTAAVWRAPPAPPPPPTLRMKAFCSIVIQSISPICHPERSEGSENTRLRQETFPL